MSRNNKVNPDHYKTAGRLSPDDLARERRKQSEPLWGATRGSRRKPMPPWMANESAGASSAEGEARPRERGSEATARNPVDEREAASQKQRAKTAGTTREKTGRDARPAKAARTTAVSNRQSAGTARTRTAASKKRATGAKTARRTAKAGARSGRAPAATRTSKTAAKARKRTTAVKARAAKKR